MKRETGKVFLACAIGAGIGSLVALEMTRAFWWIGLLVGGLSGYLSYEWRAMLWAILAAARASAPIAVRTVEGIWSELRSFFSKPQPFFLTNFILSYGFVIAFAMSWYEKLLIGHFLLIALLGFILMVAVGLLQMMLLVIPLEVRESTREKWLERLATTPLNNVVSPLSLIVVMTVDGCPAIFVSTSWRNFFEMHWNAACNIVRGLLIAIGAVTLSPFLLAYAG